MDYGNILRDVLTGAMTSHAVPPRPVESWSPDYATWRFIKAIRDTPSAVKDHAILLRQALRWNGLLYPEIAPSLGISQETLSLAGIASVGDNRYRVDPFRPSWAYRDDEPASVPLDDPPRSVVPDESERAEPWLAALHGHTTWRSPAQKEACWSALTTPEGGTTLIALPTGAGKSLVFQVVTRFSTGLTLVVVPTVALAIDHALGAEKLFAAMPAVNPKAYEASNTGDQSIRDAIRDRTCRLIFASPEACVSGSLHSVLGDAASAGWLKTVVVDEAHIVESWGADFRVDFQLLSNTLESWRQRARDKVRTFLLSATFSDQCRQTLKDLFVSGNTPWNEFVSQRLRPEMNYYVHPFSTDDARQEALASAIYHLPRPAIVYVTEVEEANALFTYCRERLGLKRVACFTGETVQRDRRSILEAWRADEVDLIIATSAFGLGVDKADVRAVVHACVPETIDRYYQEVGRGGRDGASVTCLFIPSNHDWVIAKQLTPTFLGDEKLRLRWRTLWDGRRPSENGEANVFDLPLNVRHAGLFGARSYGENVRWNKRLLLLVVRAGYARLIGSVRREDQQIGEAVADEWVRVELAFSPSDDIATLIGSRRTQELNRSEAAQRLLEMYVFNGVPICRVLVKHYGAATERACGLCPSCRNKEEVPATCRPLEVPPAIRTQPIVEVVLGTCNFASVRDRDEVVMLLRTVSRRLRARRFFCGDAFWDSLRGAFEEAFGVDGPELYRLDRLSPSRIYQVDPRERVICIHAAGYQPELEKCNREGRIVTHWIPAGTVRRDHNGRWPMLSEGARLYTDTSQWLTGTMQSTISDVSANR
jgi:ATP-dependent DNA helicase RecQ